MTVKTDLSIASLFYIFIFNHMNELSRAKLHPLYCNRQKSEWNKLLNTKLQLFQELVIFGFVFRGRF